MQNRREFVRAASLAGVASLAGCAGPTDGNGDDDSYVPTEPNYRGWFDGVSNYDGTVDARGRESVTVEVGVKGSSGFYKFGPAAVAVTPGTTVTWEWTGKGGTHNVVAEQGAFDSGKLVERKGNTFEQTISSPAIYKYFCEPHRSLGMRGAVFVALGLPE